MANTIVIDVYCYCRCPDDGWKVVASYFVLAVVASGIIWTVWNKIEREANVKNPEMVRSYIAAIVHVLYIVLYY